MPILLNRAIATTGIVLSLLSAGHAQPPDSVRSGVMSFKPEKMDWWRKARFGMFIHWGVYSVPAGVYHGHPNDGLGEWLMQDAHIPRAEYAGFAKTFNPTAYDPEKWVRLAKEAGMKYIVITAKHHDGFALFGSAASDWNIVTASPYGKDLLMPLVQACRKYGMKIGFYYSQANDWYNPGGAAAFGHWDSTQTSRSMDEYIEKVAVPQVREILTRYGDVAELWWDVPTDMTPSRAAKLKALMALQPAIITNDRLGGDVPGDITTPEQYVPATGIPGRDWETCMTMNDTWGFKVNDSNWKSPAIIVRNLVDIASKGGNYLLNVGPDAQGRFPAAIEIRLQAIGRWMTKYGESIYGTSASPFSYLPWGRCTSKPGVDETILYFHVLSWPKDGKLLVPGLSNKVVSATIFGNAQQVVTRPTEDGLVLLVPAQPTDSLVSVIRVVVQGKVVAPEYVVKPEMTYSFTLLPQQATIDNAAGQGSARVEGGDESNIGWWMSPASTVSWKIRVGKAGIYTLRASMSTVGEGSTFSLHAGTQHLKGRLFNTGGYDQYRDVELGQLSLPEAGIYTVRLVPDPTDWQPVNVRKITMELIF